MKRAAKSRSSAVQAPNRWLVNQMRRTLADKLDPVVGALADYQRNMHRGIQESLNLLHGLQEKNEQGKKSLKQLKLLLIEGASRDKTALSVPLLEEALRHLVREVVAVKPGFELSECLDDPALDLVIVLGGEEMLSEEHGNALLASPVVKAAWLSDLAGVTEVERRLAQAVDHVFTQSAENLPVYQALGCRSCRCLPFAADTEVYCPKPSDIGYGSDVLLVGSVYRNSLLGELARSPALANLKVRAIGEGWDGLNGGMAVGSEAEAAAYYNGAKLVVNGSFSLLRGQEISACGVLQLYQESMNGTHALSSETHWLPYRTVPEAEELIVRYLLQVEERRLAATRAWTANKFHHSFLQRGLELLGSVFA